MTNASFIDLLEIGEVEQCRMKTLIGPREKQRRFSEKRSQERVEKKREKLSTRIKRILEGKQKV